MSVLNNFIHKDWRRWSVNFQHQKGIVCHMCMYEPVHNVNWAFPFLEISYQFKVVMYNMCGATFSICSDLLQMSLVYADSTNIGHCFVSKSDSVTKHSSASLFQANITNWWTSLTCLKSCIPFTHYSTMCNIKLLLCVPRRDGLTCPRHDIPWETNKSQLFSMQVR